MRDRTPDVIYGANSRVILRHGPCFSVGVRVPRSGLYQEHDGGFDKGRGEQSPRLCRFLWTRLRRACERIAAGFETTLGSLLRDRHMV
jgi:hypothetical protein